MDKEGIKKIVDEKPEMRDKLFARGFLFTDAGINPETYPFYGKWKVSKINGFTLLVSPKQTFYLKEGDVSIVLVGHAYNPFLMLSDENAILNGLGKLYSEKSMKDKSSGFWREINELTGVFTLIVLDGSTIYVIGDASGMQTTFYTIHENRMFISSHTNLIGDLLNLTWDAYIEHLAHYRFFKLLGNALPGDLTQFQGVKRLIPNHYLRISQGKADVIRFYWPHRQDMTETQIVEEVAALMHANMRLISEKWEKPAISLTGGCDSKTTLACANGLYDRFRYFSYVSSEAERVDADAAKAICDALELKHTTYVIPEYGDVQDAAEIINWNTGNIRYSHPNDVRKRVFFADTSDFDVEVKSWASEIGRAYYSKRFNGRTRFGKMTPRKCTTLYKFFLNDRKLVRATDEIFKDYLTRYFEQADEKPIEWQEQFFWEFRVSSWNGLVITGEHRYSFDITIPYNNRMMLELLLNAPIEARINDSVYRDVRARMNSLIDQTGIAVTNLKHTRKRSTAENIYYLLHSHLKV